MFRNSMLAGMSVIAFAASASAQNGQNNGDTTNAQTGNRVVISCTVGNPANNCSVTQNAGTFDSTGSVNARGNGNTSTVNQAGNRQFAENRAVGDRNAAAVGQRGFSQSATISQTGSATGITANSALIEQGGTINGQFTAASGSSSNNRGIIVQVRTSGTADDAGANNSAISQAYFGNGGVNNTAVSTQNGTNLSSLIDQSQAGNSGVAASNNSATVSQVGRGGIATTGSSSTVLQEGSGNTANVSLFDGGLGTGRNNSFVRQGNTLFTAGTNGAGFAAAGGGNALTTANSPNTGNLAVVAITGQQNVANVFQNGVQNTSDVSLLNGGSGNTANANAGTNPGTGVSLTPGAGGQPNNRSQGNSSTISQTGRGNYAAVSSGGRVMRSDGTMSGGAGNLSSITQTQGDAAVTATTLNSAQTASTAHRALVYQRGTLDSVTITQNNNALGGAGRNATQSGSVADVAQLSFNSTTSITQTGTNTARVTQGARTEATGASNGITIDQTDQGDVTTTSGANSGTGFGGGTAGTAAGTSRNFTEVVQYGIQNSTSVIQNAIAASATVFQAVGTRANEALVRQGSYSAPAATSIEQDDANRNAANNGANARNLTAIVNQTAGQAGLGDQTGANTASPFGEDDGPLVRGVAVYQNGQNLTARADQQGGTATPGTGAQAISNNAILIAQAYSNSSATATQNGTNLSLQIEQRGANTNANRPNLVTVSQSGDNNAARATQTQNVGASVAGDATAGVSNDVNFPFSRSGAASAEIVISQSGMGGSATVEQRGKGQYASLTQTGTNNVGGILQTENATNAVAVLTQNGTNNTYYIQQDVAGQYIRVTQTGTGNTAAGTSIINGPSGNGNSNANPQTRPAFSGEAVGPGPL